MGKVRVQISEATSVCIKALEQAGYGRKEAATIVDHLVDAELRGHPFAGLARALSIIEHLRDSKTKPVNNIELTRDGPAFAHLDGHNSVGYLVARKATELAIEKAKAFGVSAVGANGTWYTGNLGYYAEMATREDLVIVVASNAARLVAPHGGYEARFSTNPICIEFPSNQQHRPVIWDIGTSKIMYAQVKLSERLGIPIPEGSAYDENGNPTTDPLEAQKGAQTVWGGHKGSGLAIMVQLLGIAAGSRAVTPPMSDFGYMVMAFNPGMLQPIEQVKEEADRFGELIRTTKMLPGEDPARMPFDRSSDNRTTANERGWFEVEGQVLDELRRLATHAVVIDMRNHA